MTCWVAVATIRPSETSIAILVQEPFETNRFRRARMRCRDVVGSGLIGVRDEGKACDFRDFPRALRAWQELAGARWGSAVAPLSRKFANQLDHNLGSTGSRPATDE